MNGNDRKMDENERKMNGNERKEENHLMISQTQVYRESCACVKLKVNLILFGSNLVPFGSKF